jgi:ABC-type cobalamin/Fe3+-siderophores transport systems, ATPase components
MIAKALAQDTPLIFMDEPAAFLDYPSKIELMSLMLKLSREKGKTILFSSHDLDLLIRHADKLWIVSPEKNIATGMPEDLIINGTIDRYFSRDAIHFDMKSGHFELQQQSKGTIGVASSESTIGFWVAKALQRYGYITTEFGHAITNVKTNGNKDFILSHNGKNEHFKTIEDLLKQIRLLHENK